MSAHPLAPLIDRPRWIVVKIVPRDHKADKLPIDPRTCTVTAKGSEGAHDPAVWLPHRDAAQLAAALGSGHGVGFVLVEGDDLFCIDIDRALQPDGSWPPWVHDLCVALPGTVAELSHSRTGLHLWGRSNPLPVHKTRGTIAGHPVECYSARRFILIGTDYAGTMAPHCPGFATVVDRYFKPDPAGAAPGIPAAGPRADWSGPPDDDELIALALRSRSPGNPFDPRDTAVSFAALWTADATVLARAYPTSTTGEPWDRSRADAALAQRLAFYTGADAGRVERLMRRSGLNRDKYDRPDYLPRTITAACSRQVEVYRRHDTAAAPVSQAPARLTLDAAKAAVADLSGIEARAKWVPLALQLSRPDAAAFIEHVAYTLGIPAPELRAHLRDARQAESAQRMERRLSERAQGRTCIEWRAESSTDIAAEIERLIVGSTAPGEYVSFGGVLSRVTAKPLPYTHLVDSPDDAPPAVPQIEPLGDVAVLELIERSAVFYVPSPSGGPRPVAVPDVLRAIILGKSQHVAPNVTGLLTHPIALRRGEVLNADGLHAGTGLFLLGATVPNVRPFTQAEARDALQYLRGTMLEGFEFASHLDTDVAVAALLTGVQRRLLDAAPGVAVVASTQSSGKTTLVRLVHIILTGHDMPATTFPRDETEFQKQLLSTLMRSPALVCFDNLPDGSTMRSGSLAAAMTSAVFTQRVLGASRMAAPMTNTLFCLTGNNIALGPDEVSRWLVCRLAPRSARPEERAFRHPDVLAHGLPIRADVLRCAVGIVAGYALHGTPAAGPGTRFPAWDRAVRQPLLWAGAHDVAAVFRANADDNPEGRAHGALVWALRRAYGDAWFTAAQVCALAAGTVGIQPDAAQAAAEALDAMAAPGGRGSRDTKAVAAVLRGKLGRPALIDGATYALAATRNAQNMNVYRVEHRP